MLAIAAVAWSPDGRALRILDQRELPEREVVRDLVAIDDVVDAIKTLAVRGAPAIGVAAAIGLVASLLGASGTPVRQRLAHYAGKLVGARPTAVNLAWAIERMLRVASVQPGNDDELLEALRHEATRILEEDIAMCDAIAMHGLSLIRGGARVMTHCNAGALATAGIGTALAPIYAAHKASRRVHVYANETRPLRQGARLTAWELSRAGIDVTVLPDSAAASLLRAGKIDLVIVGADRIARNGDVANKIGTYPLALAARTHNVPFYVAAPWSTIDVNTTSGQYIMIEQRSAQELEPLPANVAVYNPAFDVTPAALVSAYVTDRGLMMPPFTS